MATHWYEFRVMLGVEDADLTPDDAEALQAAIASVVPDGTLYDSPFLGRRYAMNRAERRKAGRQR